MIAEAFCRYVLNKNLYTLKRFVEKSVGNLTQTLKQGAKQKCK